MKTFFIMTFLLLRVQMFANELAWVDEQIEAIKPSRNGVSAAYINKLKKPFIFLNDTKKSTNKSNTVTSTNRPKASNHHHIKYKKHKYFTLSAIMNGYALINSTWYKLNEKVNGYTISNISLTTVSLTKNSKKIVLSTKSKNLHIKFKSQ